MILALFAGNLFFAQTTTTGSLPSRGCATPVPPQQWEAQFQQLVTQYLQQNPQQAKTINNSSSVMSGYSIPVIMHVIHGGQAVGTYPNLLQGQLNSQVTVLDNDYAGIGQNTGNYPATAFSTYATNTVVSAASKDASGRIAIANFNINFCLATKDTLGNILAEPGIDRVNYNTLPALTGTFSSKNPAAAAYNSSGNFMAFMDGYIKKNTIWNITKYLNIWVTDEPSGLGLLGYATFPAFTSLTGIPSVGTPSTDGFWSWASSFGSSTIFPGGTYTATYDKGRTCTHEIGHWLGLRHIWGDGNCVTDYCNDTPPASSANFGTPTYPYLPNTCTSASPPNGPNGEMFMNFMDYTDDLAMYMFTSDQRLRAHVAMSSSPYRNQLGTHGLCNLPAPIANFSVTPNPGCAGSVLNVGDLSLNVPSAWSYTMTGGTPSLSTVQNPTVSYATAGVYSITLIATNAAGASTPIVHTVTVTSGPAFTLTANPTTVCAGGNVTITPSGATSYTLVNNGATATPFVVSPTVATIYSVTAITGTNTCKTTQTVSVTMGSVAITINPATPTICPGQSVILTGSGATTYTWSTGPNTASISVSPTVVTTYTLSGKNAGCLGTKTVQVNLNPTPTITVNNATICPAGTATLTAGGANTYSWSTGATTSVITVSPASNTIYTVTGTSALGCVSTKTVSVTIGTGLAITVVASPTAVCAGVPSTLTASGATSYTWNTGPTGANLVVTPTVNTTYTVNGSSGTCLGSNTISVLVNASPTVNATAATATICAGSSTSLSASGAASYSWMPGSLSGANISVSPTATTIYTVTGYNALGCSNTKTVAVNVQAVPVVNLSANPTAVCAGNSSTLTASGATNYTWSVGGTGTTKTVTPIGSTVYTVTGTTGVCSATGTVNVSVNPIPTVAVNNATICPSGTATLTASGATTYSWSTSATTSVITVSPSSNTTYTVTGTSLGCSNTKTVSVTIGTALSLNITASPSIICGSGSSTLTATGATSYTWSTGPTGPSVVVTPTATTVYTVNGTSGSCSGTKTISVVLNNTPILASAGPNQTLCISSPSTTLAGNTPTLGTGIWSVMVGTATIANPALPNSAVTALGTGTNILQWQITNGGCSMTSVVYLMVNSLPTIANAGATQTVCGTASTLAGNTPATGTGNWTLISGSGAITIPASPTSGITGLGVGSNVFQWTISNSPCASSSSSVAITGVAAPPVTAVSSSSVICTGSSASLTASGATTYSWSTGANSSVIVVTPTITTSYTVTGTNGGCPAGFVLTQTVSTCTGLNQVANAIYNVLVYPNPFKEELNVIGGELVNAQVFNTLGQLIVVKTINGTGTINTSEFAKGVYYINVRGESGSKTIKIVKE